MIFVSFMRPSFRTQCDLGNKLNRVASDGLKYNLIELRREDHWVRNNYLKFNSIHIFPKRNLSTAWKNINLYLYMYM